jgi:hypothetical protein
VLPKPGEEQEWFESLPAALRAQVEGMDRDNVKLVL